MAKNKRSQEAVQEDKRFSMRIDARVEMLDGTTDGKYSACITVDCKNGEFLVLWEGSGKNFERLVDKTLKQVEKITVPDRVLPYEDKFGRDSSYPHP